MSIRGKLLLWSYIIVILVIAALTTSIIFVTRSSMEQRVILSVQDILNQVNRNINLRLQDLNDTSLLLYSNGEVNAVLGRDQNITAAEQQSDADALSALFRRTLQIKSGLNIQIFDEQRDFARENIGSNVFASNQTSINIDSTRLRADRLFIDYVNSDDPFTVGYLQPETWLYAEDYLILLREIPGGYLIVNTRKSNINEIYSGSNLVREGDVFLVSTDGDLISSSCLPSDVSDGCSPVGFDFFDSLAEFDSGFTWVEQGGDEYLLSFIMNRDFELILYAMQPRNSVFRDFIVLRNTIVGVTIGILLIVVFIIFSLSAKFTDPLIILTEKLEALIKSKEHKSEINSSERLKIEDSIIHFLQEKYQADDEVGRLAATFSYMVKIQQQFDSALEKEVAERTESLRQTLHSLEITQEQLIQTEKIAAVGALVAGLAHEINTPIGNALLSSSMLQDLADLMQKIVEKDQVSRSVLLENAGKIAEASEAVLNNIKRSAELVNSLKHVAVNQDSGSLSSFKLRTLVENVLGTYEQRFREGSITTIIEIPEALVIEGYSPGIVRIISNLIDNSLLHGFAGGAAGTISICVSGPVDGYITLEYGDDGTGISPEVQRKMFDPFYSTLREASGGGLGLHILYKLVYDQMKGRLEWESAPGLGVRFLISLPVSLSTVSTGT